MSKLMNGMGFADDATGPYVTELRELMARKAANGLRYASPGTWAVEPWLIPDEERARELLAVEWSMARQHSYEVKCLDPPVHWQYDVRRGTRRLVIKWSSIPAWLGDRWREAGMHYRIWRDRKVPNPYRHPAP